MPRCVWLPKKVKVKQQLQKKSFAGDSKFPHFQLLPNSIYFEIRELNKVYTNGTLVDGDLLTDEQAGHCVSITESAIEDDSPMPDSERKFGICILDCSTSEFNLSFFEDDICRTKLETLMRQICPKEIICKKVRRYFLFRRLG